MRKTVVAGVLKMFLRTPEEVEDLYEDIALHLNWVYQKENDFVFFYESGTQKLVGFLKDGEKELFVFREGPTQHDWLFLEKRYIQVL
ncbi:hypothetical protein KTR10_02515 [Candidatus Kaiserbacteria bacterium]|nr:hypothetical protein [Candidatus Kaiserbacteria bacterium]